MKTRIFIFVFLAALVLTPPSMAQQLTWVGTGGPPGGLGYDIRSSDHPSTWLVTDNFAGVHISTDDGATWKQSNEGIPAQSGLTFDSRPVFSLTIDPHDANIVWAGTDKTGHIYRSMDGGRTWQQRDTGVSITYDSLSFRGFTVDPRTSDIVFAMAETTRNVPIPDETGGAVYRSINAGADWQLIWDGGMPSSLARYLCIDPRDPDNVWFVSTGIFDRSAVGEGDPATDPFGGLGVLKTVDGGQSWSELDEANGLGMLYVGSLAMHADNPDILLAAAGHLVSDPLTIAYLEALDTPPNGIYRSVDGGESWSQVVIPTDENIVESFTSVEICPGQPSTIYAGSEYAVYRSDDTGLTWQTMTTGDRWGPPGVPAGWPIDMQCDRDDSQRVFANNYMGGNFLTDDGGTSWRNASTGYTGAQILGVLTHPDLPLRAWAAGRSGIWRTDDAGHSWSGRRFLSPDYPLPGAEFGALAVDPGDPEHLLTGEASILESFDGGDSWTFRWELSPATVGSIPDGLSIPLVSSVVFAPSDPQRVYAAFAERDCLLLHEPCLAGVGVIASTNGGSSWLQTTVDMGDVGVVDLAVFPADAEHVFAATENGLYETANGGTSWTLVAGLPASARVRTVAIHPSDPEQMLAGVDGEGVYASADAGQTWLPSSAGLQANGSLHDIVYQPSQPDVVYATDTFSGVYRSTDRGANWVQINDGLNDRCVTTLSMTADGQHVYVATSGQGVYRLDIDGFDPWATIFADDFESGGTSPWSSAAP